MDETKATLRLAAIAFAGLPKCKKTIGKTTYTNATDTDSSEYKDFMECIHTLGISKDEVVDQCIEQSLLF